MGTYPFRNKNTKKRDYSKVVPNEDEDKTKFNMGLAYLERINGFLNTMAEARMKQNNQLWLESLRSLYMDVCVVASKDQADEAKKLLDKTTGSFNDLAKRSKNEINYSCYQKFFAEATELEIFLKRILHEFDLLMPMEGDDGDSF
jgi:hypothetical protein